MFLSLVLFMGTSVSCMQAQPLYKIQANMTDSVTHAETFSESLLYRGFLPSPQPYGHTITQQQGLKNALAQTDQVYFEVNKGSYADLLTSAKKLTDGKKLLRLLTPIQQAKLNAFLKKYMELDFRSSYVQKKYGNLTPAALLDDLRQLLFVANHIGEYDLPILSTSTLSCKPRPTRNLWMDCAMWIPA